jgi:hypothetical protein
MNGVFPHVSICVVNSVVSQRVLNIFFIAAIG